MKKVLSFIVLFLGITSIAFSARQKSRSKTSKTTYKAPTEDECKVDIDYCFDRYCFDKKTLYEGVYSRCGATPASTILINVEDCLATRAVLKKLNLKEGCRSYSYNRIVALLSQRDKMEKGLKKNTKTCQKATRALQAAKRCYAKMISSDGSSSLALYEELDKLCGFSVSGDSYMLNRFFEAGDYGESNLRMIQDLKLTGQNTEKRENWRQVVDATLAGYTEIAELACGEEDYKLTRINQFELDERDNSAMVALKTTAEETGRQTANRIVNHWFRETDCLTAPLPTGGNYWMFEKGGNPECRLVCKEGYEADGYSSCKEVKKNEKRVFWGFNIPDVPVVSDVSEPVVVKKEEAQVEEKTTVKKPAEEKKVANTKQYIEDRPRENATLDGTLDSTDDCVTDLKVTPLSLDSKSICMAFRGERLYYDATKLAGNVCTRTSNTAKFTRRYKVTAEQISIALGLRDKEGEAKYKGFGVFPRDKDTNLFLYAYLKECCGKNADTHNKCKKGDTGFVGNSSVCTNMRNDYIACRKCTDDYYRIQNEFDGSCFSKYYAVCAYMSDNLTKNDSCLKKEDELNEWSKIFKDEGYYNVNDASSIKKYVAERENIFKVAKSRYDAKSDEEKRKKKEGNVDDIIVSCRGGVYNDGWATIRKKCWDNLKDTSKCKICLKGNEKARQPADGDIWFENVSKCYYPCNKNITDDDIKI